MSYHFHWNQYGSSIQYLSWWLHLHPPSNILVLIIATSPSLQERSSREPDNAFLEASTGSLLHSKVEAKFILMAWKTIRSTLLYTHISVPCLLIQYLLFW